MPKTRDISNITGYFRDSLNPYNGPESVTLADGLDETIEELSSPRTRWPIRNMEEREPVSPAKRAIIYQRDGEQCWYCWTGGGGPLQLDHIIMTLDFAGHHSEIRNQPATGGF